MCLAQGPQQSDAGEARTQGPSVTSQDIFNFLETMCRYIGDDICIQLLVNSVHIREMNLISHDLCTYKRLKMYLISYGQC